MSHVVLGLGCLLLVTTLQAADLPDWVSQIRTDHPRLFFNADTFEQVKAMVAGEAKPTWDWTVRSADNTAKKLAGQAVAEAKPVELGPQAAHAAFVYLVTGDRKYLEAARGAMYASLAFYEQCLREKKAVNWYSTTRVHWILAWDWLYNDLEPAERQALMERLVDVIDGVLTARPRIYRENYSGYSTGFYGVHNCLWFLGCTTSGTGIREAKVNEWLVWGHDENLKLLAHRKHACGDDGGSASAVLGYCYGAYPWVEQNYFYTWLSATGRNIAPDWPHSAWFANYVIWNWIEADDGGVPYEFGYGDTPHTDNRTPLWQMYTHMANVRHLYGRGAPDAAGLARYLQDRLKSQGYSTTWFIYPFLLTKVDDSPPPLEPKSLPHARLFENMGQLFMRSGTSADDTYCLFSAGGVLAQHRHYDALNFAIYKHGHQALDTGTRWQEFKNGAHLSQYYAQTVAHNCVLIHLPNEPTARYWGEFPKGESQTNYPCYGGQSSQLGSEVKAFETNDLFTYVAADATKCYRPEKCRQCTRQLVFLMPNHFVIFDRVTSAEPSQRKEWLLHPASEPQFDGTTFRSEHLGGAMLCRTLLPEQPRFNVVGGPGNEFRTGDRNWEIYRGEPGQKGSLTPEQLRMIGQWRVEVTDPSETTDNLFLHVIEVGDKGLQQMVETELVRNGDRVGVKLSANGRTSEVVFNQTGELGGHIRISGAGGVDRELTGEVLKQVGIMAAQE